MAPERRNEKTARQALRPETYVAQNKDFMGRYQQNQDFSPDQAAQVAENKE